MDSKKIYGKRILLRRLSEDDIENGYYEWFNDPITTSNNSHGESKLTKEDAFEFLKKTSENESIEHFSVVSLDNNLHIGCCSLQKIDKKNKSCEMARIIGHKDYRGIGLGTEIGELLLKFGFNELNLNRIWVGNFVTNIAAINSIKKLGFTPEGVLREYAYKSNAYHDVMISSILKSEYKG